MRGLSHIPTISLVPWVLSWTSPTPIPKGYDSSGAGCRGGDGASQLACILLCKAFSYPKTSQIPKYWGGQRFLSHTALPLRLFATLRWVLAAQEIVVDRNMGLSTRKRSEDHNFSTGS